MDLEVLLKVIMVNIVLSGDNAVLIALAVRNVPKNLQKRAIFWGTTGAIVLRLLFAVFIVWLLKIPFLMFIGGLLLIHIAYKLIVSGEGNHAVAATSGSTLRGAIKTIIVADAVMSLDNVLALAGVAGSLGPIFIGVIISVPIIIWGSQIILHAMERAPIIMYFGAALLAWTAGEMMMREKFVSSYIHAEWFPAAFSAMITVLVLGLGYLSKSAVKH